MRPRRPAVLAGAGLILAASLVAATPAALAAPVVRSPLVVAASGSGPHSVFRDGGGREITLRGFNVAGSAKLYENGLLPFRSTADAATSAQAMRDLTGANAVRFLITWEGVQPTPNGIDTGYLTRAAEQIRQFTDRGIYVLVDYHQDLYSSHLFNAGSWYTGDGAPQWVIDAGGYPTESCGICLVWGQNMQTNNAVRKAAYDFWHNRTITTPAGVVGVQTAFLTQATAALRYLKQALPAASYSSLLGLDVNEPFDGGTDGASGPEWERAYLMPFYQRLRAAMDTAGWADRQLYTEPLVFWNTGFFESGGLTGVGALGPRYVFNSHYYDGARITLDPTPAGDGTYAGPMNRIRTRAAELGTAPLVSEFGNRLSGNGSDRTPWMVRSMFQGMDAGIAGARWWTQPAAGGPVLSSTMWHWDLYPDRHHELMNGNPDRVRTADDAWNDEDHSVVYTDATGAVVPRLDRRVLDRVYPSAVAGTTLAFAYEDLARSGYGGSGTQKAWLTVPSSLPALSALVAGRQYGVLVWRQPSGTAPTELHLPASFAPAGTVVVSDVASSAISVSTEPGSTIARRLVINAGGAAGTVHVLLVANGGGPVPDAARAELINWAATKF
jgi:hypothetical protein